MPSDGATERLIAALCELHNAEIEFIVSRMARFIDHNPNASIDEAAAKGPEIEEELQEFEDGIRDIIKEEVNSRFEGQNAEDSPQYPEGSVERMVSDCLAELE